MLGDARHPARFAFVPVGALRLPALAATADHLEVAMSRLCACGHRLDEHETPAGVGCWCGCKRFQRARDTRWAWNAPRRRDAVSQLVRHIEESP